MKWQRYAFLLLQGSGTANGGGTNFYSFFWLFGWTSCKHVWSNGALFSFHSPHSIHHIIYLIPENATDENRQDLLAELNTMKKLEPHQNVIQLLGCVTKSGKNAL